MVEEANAISTAFVRADLMPAAERARIRPMLREYVGLRITDDQNLHRDLTALLMDVGEAVDRSEQIQRDLWSIGVAIAAEHPTAISSLFLHNLFSALTLKPNFFIF